MKAFFCHGLASGIRLSTAARGYDRRKDAMSLTDDGQAILLQKARMTIRSSTEAPVAEPKYWKARGKH